MEIKQRRKQTHFFVLWTVVHYSVLIICPLHSQKMWKNSPNYPRKQEKIDGIGVYLVSSEFCTQNCWYISTFEA